MVIKKEELPFIYTFPNGLRLIHKRCKGDVSCCGFVVKAGTRDELDDEHGLAHFTEHLIFKGTSGHKAGYILNRMERVGGELNAYTTKEETFVYSVFLKKDFKRAVSLMSELMFDSVFPEEELVKEREVIMDEINSYEDDPSELIYDDFEEMLFPDNPLGKKILGTRECLNSFNSEKVKAFYKRNYRTDNVVFYSQSPLPGEKVLTIVKEFAGDISNLSVPGSKKTVLLQPAKGMEKYVNKDTHQCHVLYGNTCYSMFDDRRIPFILMNNILGGPAMNSILNVSMRERSGLVYNVESNINSYSDTGVFSIYFGADKKNFRKCFNIVKRELDKFMNKGISKQRLSLAKNQIYAQLMIASENKESSSLALGKSMLHYNNYDTNDELARKIEEVTPEMIMETANDIFAPEKMSLLVYR